MMEYASDMEDSDQRCSCCSALSDAKPLSVELAKGVTFCGHRREPAQIRQKLALIRGIGGGCTVFSYRMR